MCAALLSEGLFLAALRRGRDDAAELESRCLAEVETGAAIRHVNGTRPAKHQNVRMAVGALGILEAEPWLWTLRTLGREASSGLARLDLLAPYREPDRQRLP